MAASSDTTPCRWAALQGDSSEDPNLVDLPPVEQVSRGKELLNMLQPSVQLTPAQRSQRPPRPPTKLEQPKAENGEVQMIVKRTFIELIAPPAAPTMRPRAYSDSAVTRGDLNLKPSGSSEALAEMSEASTDAPSDREEAASQPWSAEAELAAAAWRAPQPELLSLPSSGVDAAQMGQMMPAACMASMVHSGMPAMPGMWMQTGYETGYDEASGYYPYSPMSMDPMMWGQWAYVDPYTGLGEGQAFESPQPTPNAASSRSRGFEAVGAVATQEPVGPKTTVLLRNLPSDFTRTSLLELLEDEGFDGTFDFIYLPMDFGAKVCLGYAFVNFVSGADADRCWEIFGGYSDWTGEKACEVTWGEPCQGLQAHIDRYRNSPVMHKSIPEEWKPLIFKDGARVPFPPPTKSISAPKLRRRAGRDEQLQTASA